MTAVELARKHLVDGLCAGGRVHSRAVEEALRAVPRHLFLPELEPAAAYADEAVPVQLVDGVATSSASQPSMVAIMLEQLALARGHRVLEIGAGTGYNAALMARIVGPGGSVTAVDIDADLVAAAAGHLATADVDAVTLVCADGAVGHAPGAPYDRIVLTVGSADVRPEWVTQLAPGGRLLLPLAVRGSQLSVALDVDADGVLHSSSVRSCSFIRLRGIGAQTDVSVVLPDGPAVRVPAGEIDPVALGTALREPGEPVAAPVSLGAEDVWDGFGLWLALTEPGAARLLAAGPSDGRGEADEWLGPAGAAVALVSLVGEKPAGLAVAVPSAAAGPGPAAGAGRPDPVLRVFGRAGGDLARRLCAAMQAWSAAGSPGAAEWTINAAPRAGPAPPGAIATEHCWLQLTRP